MSDIDKDAQIVWDYLHMEHSLQKSDAVFVLCSMDTRVAERAADLFNQGLGKYLIISGGAGKLTKDIFDKPEAQVFAEIARNQGVPEDKIIIEDKSTNTGENVRFTYELLKEKNLNPRSLILVQKPYMERRTFATFKKQWPGKQIDILVTSPQIPYSEYFTEKFPKDFVLNIMVGDMQRIKEYPKLGMQIEQEMPTDVWAAYERLVAAGYTSHLI
ncbi:MAG: YdcF family protein [Candidatus Saccharimonadales bacterium]